MVNPRDIVGNGEEEERTLQSCNFTCIFLQCLSLWQVRHSRFPQLDNSLSPRLTSGSMLASTDHTDQSTDEPNICASGTVTPHRCWKHSASQWSHVSVGPAGVWGVSNTDYVYYLPDTYGNPEGFGTVWQEVIGLLSNLEVGTDIIWGVNSANYLFQRTTITASNPTGSTWSNLGYGYTWVSVSPGGSVWAVNTAGHLLHYRHSSNAQPVGTAWDVMDTELQRVDAGQAGVWALKTDGRLFYRHGTYGDNGSTGTDWRSVEGTFTSVSLGKNVVVMVDTAGHVWVRSGVSSDTPAGLAWLRYPGYMKQVDVYQTDQVVAMWAVDFDDQVYFSLM